MVVLVPNDISIKSILVQVLYFFSPEPNVFISTEQLESFDRDLPVFDRPHFEVLELLSEEPLLEQLLPPSCSRQTLSSQLHPATVTSLQC